MTLARITPWVLLLAACRMAPVVPGSESVTELVDTRVAKGWREAGIEPAPGVDDAEFLRRVWLDVAGRTPTPEQARAFLDDPSPTKRVGLVDALVAGDDAADHLADRWVAVLIGRDPSDRPALREALHGVFARGIHDGVPFDELVRSLLVAEGQVSSTPEASLLARLLLDPPEVATGRVTTAFLGLRIQCAQCHDHPTDDRWKRADFYGMEAWFARTKLRRKGSDGPLQFRIEDVPRGETKIPKDDGSPGAVQPPTFLGRALAVPKDANRREVLASALTRSPLFAKTVVNRAWRDLFGRALVEPVDDLGAEDDASHPPLLRELALDFATHGHDVRRLVRGIVLSEAYWRASAGGQGQELERHFARSAVRPMSPEQLFRSLAVATGAEATLTARVGEDAAQRRLDATLRQYLFAFGDDELGEADTFEGSLAQALLLLNGDLPSIGARPGKEGTLDRVLRSTPDRDTRLESLYLATYSRRPTADERAAASAFLTAHSGKPAVAWADLFHAMLTSVEATVVH